MVYGLESVMLPTQIMNKLNTFQSKGLRKILGMKTTFVERANTNKKVFEKANEIKNPKGIEGGNVKPFSRHIRADVSYKPPRVS